MDRLVSTAWLEDQLEAPDLRILDCSVVRDAPPEGGRVYRSGRRVWDKGHIPGSAHVDLIEELSDRSSPLPFMLPPAGQFNAVMSCRGVGRGTRVVLYDSTMNVWAARMWWMLRAFGFDAAAVLDGGWQAWTAEKRPSSTEPAPEHPRSSFVAQFRPGVFVNKDHMQAALADPGACVVNALERAVHRGERGDYARPGHIPGSCNVPYLELVDPKTHRYRPTDQLWATFEKVLAASPGRVITYCGAGIAASSDAFALGLLGVENLAIYDGSLSEWAADASLPLELGD